MNKDLLQQTLDAMLLHHTDRGYWETRYEAMCALRQAIAQPAIESANFQQRVAPWMQACFGPEISADRMERNHRFFEEATELIQANGMPRSEAHQLVDYTFGRPVGELNQEAGGVMVTLAALCLASGIDMHAAAETELARIWTKVDLIRAKQAAKPKHSPLPVAQSVPPADHIGDVNKLVPLIPTKEMLAAAAKLDYESPNDVGWCDGYSVMLKAAPDLTFAQPVPPPECKTDAEKTAFAFGWWRAMEQVRDKERPVTTTVESLKVLLARCRSSVALQCSILREQEGAAYREPEADARELIASVDDAIAQPAREPLAWIEHHKAGDNLNWERVDHPYAKATPLCACTTTTKKHHE